MADFDVQAVALASPPQPAFVTSYRPAVLVRNNGVHEAYAAGLLRIYTAGKLIFTTDLLSGLIQPKATKEALGLEYWTPPAAGTYMCIAYVTTEHDQVPGNDNLAPVTFSVSGLPPPPPPGVTAHAAQHEENAADEIDLDGLKGRLTDAQTPIAHKATHMPGGSDLISVDGLAGTLLDPQPIADHHETHEDHGDDEMNVDELSGVLKNLQKPKVHANEAHDPNYATDSDLTSHKTASAAHENRRGAANGFCPLDATAEVPRGNLAPVPSGPGTFFLKLDKTWTQAQEISEKGQAEGYPELDEYTHVPSAQLGSESASPPEPSDKVLFLDQTWRVPLATVPGAHKATHEDGGDDEISIAGLSGLTATQQTPAGHHARHEPGGDDVLSGLPPAPHKVNHQVGGSDEISIAGLSGRSATAQRADILTFRGADKTVIGTDPETQIATAPVPAAWITHNCCFEMVISGHMVVLASASQTLTIYWVWQGVHYLNISLAIPLAHNTDFVLRVRLFAIDGFGHTAAYMVLERAEPSAGQKAISIDRLFNLVTPAIPSDFNVNLLWGNSVAGSFVHMEAWHFVSLGQKDT